MREPVQADPFRQAGCGVLNEIVVLITASNRKEGKRIADCLVSRKLAACVNVIPGLWSVYWWKGKKETASEVLLIAKTVRGLLKDLTQTVRKEHSYSVPEVIALPISGGNKDYLDWLKNSIRGKR